MIWKTVQWPAAIVFVVLSYSVIYLLRPRFKGPALVLDYSRLGIWCVSMASGFCRIPLISAFLNTDSAVYGSLGALMILLVWLYVTALAFLVGGAVNAEIERAATTNVA